MWERQKSTELSNKSRQKPAGRQKENVNPKTFPGKNQLTFSQSKEVTWTRVLSSDCVADRGSCNDAAGRKKTRKGVFGRIPQFRFLIDFSFILMVIILVLHLVDVDNSKKAKWQLKGHSQHRMSPTGVSKCLYLVSTSPNVPSAGPMWILSPTLPPSGRCESMPHFYSY